VNIKLDENLSRHLKDQLLPLGHNVSTAFEEGLLGKVDVTAAAKGEDRAAKARFSLIVLALIILGASGGAMSAYGGRATERSAKFWETCFL